MSERRKVRHFLNGFLGVISGSAVLGILLVLWIWFGVFQEGIFQESLEKSGYYEALYQDWKTQIDAKLEEIAVPADAVDEEALKLRFMVEIKNQSGMWAAGDEIGEMVSSYFEENKFGLTQKAEAGFSSWKQEINVLTCDRVKIPFVKVWNEKRNDMIRLLPDMVMKMAIIWAVSVVILFFIQHFRHRSFRYAGYACFTAGLVMMIFCGAMWMFENRTCAEWLLHMASYEMNHITYADFLPTMEGYLRQVWRNGLYLGGGGMLVGAFGVALSYLLRKH
ncbi:MAG: hypothetical protein Q4E24_16390 [bacterium]|nr:hypothetical protein [bacterium]